MEHEHSPQRRAAPPSRRQRRLRRRLRLVRNWVLFLSACAAAMALMTTGILWLLPRAHALIAGPEVFEASQYDGSAYALDLADARLTLVNANLPLAENTAPALAVADDATGVQLEAEAAQNYRTMAAAAQQQGVTLTLAAGYQDTADEYATGYGADILSADSTEKSAAFAKSRAYEWLKAYAAEYGFVERWPEDRQAATGMAYAPWHWRYVGKENALALRASGLSLEEFLALGQLSEAN